MRRAGTSFRAFIADVVEPAASACINRIAKDACSREQARIPRSSHARKKLIPAGFSRTHTAPRPVHPRALREASLSGTGWRWPRTGATRTPNARRLKLHGPGATDGVTGLFGGSAVTPCRTARRCSSPKRWIANSATGGHAEESLKTPRAGRWREGGLAVLPIPDGGLGRDRRSASVWRHAEARGSVGPPASRAPSDFISAGASAEWLGRKRAARTVEPCLMTEIKFCNARAPSHPSPRGEGGRAEAIAEQGRVGSHRAIETVSHPAARYRSRPPSPGGEG
jgi:hypothetical protein